VSTRTGSSHWARPARCRAKMSQQSGSIDAGHRSVARAGPAVAETFEVAVGAGAFGDEGATSRLTRTVAFGRSRAMAVSSAETDANRSPARHHNRATARSVASALCFGGVAMRAAAVDSEAQASKPSASVRPAERNCRSVKPISPTRDSRPRSAAPTAKATPSPAEPTRVSVTPSRTASGCSPL
jgi:hypothetical protein